MCAGAWRGWASCMSGGRPRTRERACWAIDGRANVVAEISAALNVSRGRASGQLQFAIALRERLPKVLEVFKTGAIDYRMMAALVNRSDNITDPEVLARLDAALATWSPKWMKLSGPTLTERIDMWVEKFDPTGRREPRPTREDRYVEIGPAARGWPGFGATCRSPRVPHWMIASMRWRPRCAAMMDAPVAAPRRCAVRVGRRAGSAGVRVWGRGLPGRRRRGHPVGAGGDPGAGRAGHADRQSPAPGYLAGFGAVPAPLLRELAESAKLKPLPLPPPIAEPGYRPSAVLAGFVRCRALTCRFPGCEAPAAVCQIDHTIRIRSGRPIRRISSCSAGFTICSRPSTPGRGAGPIASPTAR